VKFGIFYEHQLPRPWNDKSEHQLYHEALDQIELADRLGIDYAWEVEHHFLEEYAHSSAPEVFLAACSQRTENIRLGHGIKLMLPPYNPPQRVAEQVATLDIVSDGRVEFGTGKSSSRTELEGFGIDPDEKDAMWEEATREVANMMTMEPYPGYDGEFFSMPCRNVVPKPVQKPHPPLWMACSRKETIELAARRGVGALSFAFTDPQEAREWQSVYYDTLRECHPIGHAVNPNIAMVTGFSCHPDEEEARRRGEEGFLFFAFALTHYYVHGTNTPGYTEIWKEFQNGGRQFVEDLTEELEDGGVSHAIGTPEQIRDHLRAYEKAGVDQVIFVQQGGKNEHEHICESLQLFAEEVMPEFHEREAERARQKQQKLEPVIEAALDRKEYRDPVSEEEAPGVEAYGVEVMVEEDGD